MIGNPYRRDPFWTGPSVGSAPEYVTYSPCATAMAGDVPYVDHRMITPIIDQAPTTASRSASRMVRRASMYAFAATAAGTIAIAVVAWCLLVYCHM
jgi:hypothetical protein